MGAVAISSARADWPEFRGPTGNGMANLNAAPPVEWSEANHVKWKAAIPNLGWSTPVVMGGQVWVTSASADGKDYFAFCLDASTGKVVFEKKLFHTDTPEPLGNSVNCYASPSPAIEKGRVYLNFGSYGTACLDAATGEVLWERRDLPCRHFRGPGSSVIVWENLLILTMDGIDVQYVAALDKTTGKTVWKTDRTANWDDLDKDGKPQREGDFRKAFSTPLVVTVDGKPMMISVGSKAAYGYDPKTGRELWKVNMTNYSSAARPVYGKGMAYISTGQGKQPELWAVKVDGQGGDVTKTHVAWKVSKIAPKMPSTVLVDDLLYLLADDGTLSCLDAATGEQVWKERLGGDYTASPVYANGKLYCSSRQGKTTVVKAGRKFEALSVNRLEGEFMASPAVSGKSLFLRTKTHLYCIETSGK